MLSIGLLAPGQQAYYQREAANSVEGYYAGEGEAPGRWVGGAAASLGLTGLVQPGQLEWLMEGKNPLTGEDLRETAALKVAGIDLTWSMPKSMSLLYALGDDHVKRAIVQAHEQAVGAGLQYLDQTAVFVRRGKGGGTYLHGSGLFAAAYRHRMSRGKDPHVHTHVVCGNMAIGEDGRCTAVSTTLLHRAALTAGYLYQAEVRSAVREQLGLRWTPVVKGMAEIEGFDKSVLKEFSRRRREIEEELAKAKSEIKTKQARSKVAVNTRAEKSKNFDLERWQEEVVARAAEHGLTRKEFGQILERGRAALAKDGAAVDTPDLVGLFDRLVSDEGLTEKKNVFTDRDVLRELAAYAQQGERVSTLISQGGDFAAQPAVMHTNDRKMTVAGLVDAEKRLVAAAVGRADEGVAQLPAESVERSVRRALNPDQRLALQGAVASGHGVDVIEALAGTGKTYTAGALREVYEAAGHTVIGIAPTGQAARELSGRAGIASWTLASRITAIQHGAWQIPQRAVIVLDEASLAGTRQTMVLLEAARDAGAKIVAIGDQGQLHSVAAGGWMNAVGRKIGVLKLSEVMRQENPEERAVLSSLHDRRPAAWMDWARESGRVSFGDVHDQLAGTLIQWEQRMAEYGMPEAVLIARSNETRDALNHMAREVAADHQLLGRSRTYGDDDFEVAVGERIICRRNDRGLDVDNGTRGTVLAVGRRQIKIHTDLGGTRVLPADYVAEHVEYAYALTCHGVQGATVQWAGVVALPHELTKGWSYTALSRARGETLLFVLAEGAAWQHHDLAAREEFAPHEIIDHPSEDELAKRVVGYMRQDDTEELAIERLRETRRRPARARPELEKTRAEDPGRFLAYFSPERRERLEQRIRPHVDEMRTWDEARLRERVSDGRPVLKSLDRTAAAMVNRLERELAEREREFEDCERSVHRLAGQAGKLGRRDRRERDDLLGQARKLQSRIDVLHAEMAQRELELGRLSSERRHPDQWLEDHALDAAPVLSAMSVLYGRDRARAREQERERSREDDLGLEFE